MDHFYSVTQSMSTGDISIGEWDVVKETSKTVTYSYNNSTPHTKNKDCFNQVHLNSKSDYTGRFQDAYVFVGICGSKEEALQKAAPIFKEWHDSLSNGLSKALEEIKKLEEVEEELEL